MVICPTCNNQCNDGAAFCPNCGQQFVQTQNYGATYGTAQQPEYLPPYVVLQVTLKERFIGTSSKNLGELEAVINAQAAKGYRLHTITTASGMSTGFGGGDRIQATMVFEKL